MKKILALIFGLFLGTTALTNAQVEFMHSLGISLYAGGNGAGGAGTYSPRLNLVHLGDNGALSLGTHFSLGGSFSSQEGASGVVLDFPLMAEVNFGNGSTKDNDKSFGFFGGLGFDIINVVQGASDNVDHSSGIMVDAGIKFVLKEKIPLSLRASYLISSNPSYPNILGLGLSWNFGVIK